MSESRVIRMRCPVLTCQRVLAVPSDARGKLVLCRGCGARIKVPPFRNETAVSAEPDTEPASD